MKNPWMSAWLSAANALTGAARAGGLARRNEPADDVAVVSRGRPAQAETGARQTEPQDPLSAAFSARSAGSARA